MSDRPPEITSPPWQPGTRLAVGVLLLAALVVVGYRLRQVLAPAVLALMLAYLLHPLEVGLRRRLRLSKGAAVLLSYLTVLLVVAGLGTGMGFAISQQVAGLVADLREISRNIPLALDRLGEITLTLGPWTLDLSTVNLDPLLSALASALQPFLTQTGALIASAASATASAVGLLVVVLVLSVYILLDLDSLGRSVVAAVPPEYQADVQRLLQESATVWQAFLRGQLILGLAVGGLVAVVLTVLGVRFSLVLGLIAGLLEFVPIFGPTIAGLIAVVVALFQGSNWWGLPPLGFALLTLAVFVLIQQVENAVLVPRILGMSLRLNPAFVLLAALAGGALAGVLGVLLAVPVMATLRLWLGYLYRKVAGLDTWPAPVLEPHRPSAPPDWWRRVRKRLGSRSKNRPAKETQP